MKKLLAFTLIAVLSLLGISGAYAEGEQNEIIGTSGNALGFAALDALYAANGNTVISPVSLSVALTMAAEGAQGDTRAQLAKALGVDDISIERCKETLASLANSGVKYANAMFLREGVTVLDGYKSAICDTLGASLFDVSLSDIVAEVNKWASEHTDGMIENLLTEEPDPNLTMMLLNATMLDAKWSSPFISDTTTKETFHSVSGDTEVDMMHAKKYYDYAELEDGTQVVKLTYTSGDLCMYVLLPQEGKLPELLHGLRDMSALENMSSNQVVLSLPKVSLTASCKLKDVIVASGAPLAFDPANADFSGMSSDFDMYISDVIQKARLDVFEEGTRAAAVTVVAMESRGAMPGTLPDPVEMNVNRPYAMLIADESTGAILFAAAVGSIDAAA